MRKFIFVQVIFLVWFLGVVGVSFRVHAYTCQSNGITCCPNACWDGTSCNCGFSSPGNCTGSSQGACGGSAQCASGSTIVNAQSANPKCSWVCTAGDTSNQGCGPANGCAAGQIRTCNCVSQNNWQCTCTTDNVACPVATSTPVPTSPPGCTPSSCNTTNCSSTACGQPCGNNGCGGTCSTGTSGCGPGPGTVQGIKAMMPSNQGGVPANTQVITPDGNSGDTRSSNPYFFFNVNAGLHSFATSIPPGGYGVGYSVCTSLDAQCGAANDPAGRHTYPNINVGSSYSGNLPGGGLMDLWFHYYPPPTGSISGPACLNAGVAGTYNLARSAVTGGSTQAVYYAPNGTQSWTQVGATAGYSMNVTIPSPGDYDIVTNVNGLFADRCTGNPVVPADWGDCGGADKVDVTVYAFPAVPPAITSLASACSGTGQSNGSTTISWSGGGSYDIMRYPGSTAPTDLVADTLTPVLSNYSSPALDSSATCGSTYMYGLRSNNSCNGHSYRWFATPVVIKCNPATPSAPTAGTGAYTSIAVGNWTAGDTMWKTSVLTSGVPSAPAVSSVPATPYATSVLVTPDSSVTCNDPVAVNKTYYYYAARRSFGSGANICYANSVPSNSGSCLIDPQWFLTSGGDVTAAHSTDSTITNNQLTPPANVGGVITAKTINWGVTDYKAGTLVSTSLVSNYAFNTLYDHAKAKAGAFMIPDATTYTSIDSINSSACTLVDNVCYKYYTGTSLTLDPGTLTKNMVIFYGGSGAVIINGNITVGVGAKSFALIAKGDIEIDSSVGTAGDPRSHADNLQGIYIAGGTFYDMNGTLDLGGKTLRVNGSVVGLGGVSMTRTTGTSTYPRDYFVFNPGYVLNLPSGLKVGNRLFQELTP